jgi:hypothetical protein
MPSRDDLRHTKVIPWWTLILWILFAVSVIPGQMARTELDYLVVSWWVAAAAGIAAGVMGLRGRTAWQMWAVLAAAVLVVSTCVYWSLLVNRLMPDDERNAVATALQRVWQMVSGGVQTGIRDGLAHWAFATTYREMVMPILQLLTLAIAGYLWIARRGGVERHT